jgi:hypothetical protein
MTQLRDLAVSDSGFLFDPFTGSTFSVNPSGKFILDKLRGGADVDAVVAAVREAFIAYDTHDLVRDAQEFILLLKEHGLLQATPKAKP